MIKTWKTAVFVLFAAFLTAACALISLFTPLPRGQIAFVSNRTGARQIWVMNVDGSNQRQLTFEPAVSPEGNRCPSWSPDGTQIAFESSRDSLASQDVNNEIYVMNADGSNQIRLTNNPAWDSCPVWSPDGARILFTSDRLDHVTRLFAMKADGSGQQALLQSLDLTKIGVLESYGWLPDGNSIFAQMTPQNTDLTEFLTIDLSSEAITNTIRLDYKTWSMALSPDGRKVAFIADAPPPYTTRLLVLHTDGSGNPTELASSLNGYKYNITWSPDGRFLAFVYGTTESDTRFMERDIYLMRTDGSDLTLVTSPGSGANEFPAWSPK